MPKLDSKTTLRCDLVKPNYKKHAWAWSFSLLVVRALVIELRVKQNRCNNQKFNFILSFFHRRNIMQAMSTKHAFSMRLKTMLIIMMSDYFSKELGKLASSKSSNVFCSPSIRIPIMACDAARVLTKCRIIFNKVKENEEGTTILNLKD